MDCKVKIVIVLICFFMVGTILIQPVANTDTGDLNNPADRDTDQSLEVQTNPENAGEETITITKISKPDMQDLDPVPDNSGNYIEQPDVNPATTPSTRASSRETPDWADDYTNAEELTGPFPQSISGEVTRSDDDEDWFKIQLIGDDGTGSSVDNLTVRPTSIQSDGFANPTWNKNALQIFIFSSYDYGGPFETSNLIFMDAMGYIPWTNYQSTWEDCYSHAFKTGTYYVMVKGYFIYWNTQRITYTIEIDNVTVTPDDFNQVPESADSPTAGNTYFSVSERVDQDRDIFDWYKINAPTGKNYKYYNYTLSFGISTSQTTYQDTSHFSGTVYFECEVNLLLFHDINKDPFAIYTLGQGSIFNKNSSAYYSVNTTQKIAYAGIYVQMYGRTANGAGPYYFVEYGSGSQRHMAGFAKYKLYLSMDYIINPILTEERVKPYTGRTYDDYTYRISYSDENNEPPVLTQIRIDNQPLEEMEFESFNISKDNYRDGAYYEFTMNGVRLGEGMHTYSFIFKDYDGYASRSNIVFNGPYISDNIAPQIRITASDHIKIYEDSGHHFLNLLTIFDDVDDDPMTFKIQQGDHFVSGIETEYATYTIWANDTLRITPKDNAYGIDTIYLNATDSNKAYVEALFELSVEIMAVNDPPQIKKYLGEWVIQEDSILTNKINLNDYFYEPIEPEQQLNFGSEPVNNVMVSIEGTGEVIITPDENWYGEVPIKFWASDNYDTIYNVLRLKVESVNDLPVFKNPHGFVLYEGEWSQFDLTAYDPIEKEEVHIETNMTDEVNEKLVQAGRIFDASSGGLVMGENVIIENDPLNDTNIILRIKPTNEMAANRDYSYPGKYFINLSAVDASGGTISYTVSMTVLDINDPPNPVILEPENGTVYYLDDYIHLFGRGGDPDEIHGYTNEYLWSSNLDGELGREKHLTKIRLNTTGTHIITFQVTDDETTAQVTIHILVLEEEPEAGDGDGEEPVDEKNILGLESSESNFYFMIIGLIIIVIFALIGTFLSIQSKKIATSRSKKEPEAEELRLPEEVQSLLAPQKVICSHCKTVLAVVSKRRPLSVSCHECGKKSVVYHPGRSVMETGLPEEEELVEPPEVTAKAELKGESPEEAQKQLPSGPK
ncbi:MAG: hypothetical protein JSV49_12080 [Thermoplasmata archaeon]|nr:MAG: hypothetical protein JSV49_12080 [Thermoplasmata archaeon]